MVHFITYQDEPRDGERKGPFSPADGGIARQWIQERLRALLPSLQFEYEEDLWSQERDFAEISDEVVSQVRELLQDNPHKIRVVDYTEYRGLTQHTGFM